MTIWTALMVLAGGLFAGGVVTIAWSHSPAWRTMPVDPFVTDFRRTIRTADKVQPALLVVSIATAIAVAIGSEGTARTAAAIGAAGFVSILIASVALLVPLQQRIIGCPPEDAERARLDALPVDTWASRPLGVGSRLVPGRGDRDDPLSA